MTVSASVVLLLGIAVVFLVKHRAMGAGAAIVAMLLGFYLADTEAAPAINDLTNSVVTAVGNAAN